MLYNFFRFVKTVSALRPRPSPRCRKPYYFRWGFLNDISTNLSFSAHLLFLILPESLLLAPNSEALSQLEYSDKEMEDASIRLLGSKEDVQSISDWFSDFHDMRQGLYVDTDTS